MKKYFWGAKAYIIRGTSLALRNKDKVARGFIYFIAGIIVAAPAGIVV